MGQNLLNGPFLTCATEVWYLFLASSREQTVVVRDVNLKEG